MGACWAGSLGGCTGKGSREHIVSKSLFITPSVTIVGLPWCKDQPREVGIESLTARILCNTHNNALSPLDNAAGRAFDIFRQCSSRNNQVNQRSPLARLRTAPATIDAKLLERWFLKTLLNLTYRSEYLIGPEGIEPGLPPLNLVETCFGRKAFDGSAGMYVAANIGMLIRSTDALQFAPLTKDNRVLGGFFEFRGFRFFLSLMSDDLGVPLSSIPGIGEGWENAKLLRPFEKITEDLGPYISHTVVRFNW